MTDLEVPNNVLNQELRDALSQNRKSCTFNYNLSDRQKAILDQKGIRYQIEEQTDQFGDLDLISFTTTLSWDERFVRQAAEYCRNKIKENK